MIALVDQHQLWMAAADRGSCVRLSTPNSRRAALLPPSRLRSPIPDIGGFRTMPIREVSATNRTKVVRARQLAAAAAFGCMNNACARDCMRLCCVVQRVLVCVCVYVCVCGRECPRADGLTRPEHTWTLVCENSGPKKPLFGTVQNTNVVAARC